jgi:K+-transporting ATPase ATPase C chain
MNPKLKTLSIALRATALTLVVTGLAYPLVMTGIAQLLFPDRANGSFVSDVKGQIVGSELIAQGFKGPAYFQPRPSAAGDNGFDAAGSSGSNLGPTSKKLRDRASADLARITKENPGARSPVPAELLTASGSGLDPDLSPAVADWQVPRIASARGIAPSRVTAIVDALKEDRELGFLGEPRVNVLLLNVALDRQFGRPARTSTTVAAHTATTTAAAH